MSTPDPIQSSRWSDETVPQPAGAEGLRNPLVEGSDRGDLSGAVMPSVERYLDETGEAPSRPLGGWQGTWIEDA